LLFIKLIHLLKLTNKNKYIKLINKYIYKYLDIKERAVFAIRNLCYRNPENQKIIESLEAKGVDKSVNLDEMGIDAEIDENGKLHVKRLPKKDIKKESSSGEEESRIQELN